MVRHPRRAPVNVLGPVVQIEQFRSPGPGHALDGGIGIRCRLHHPDFTGLMNPSKLRKNGKRFRMCPQSRWLEKNVGGNATLP